MQSLCKQHLHIENIILIFALLIADKMLTPIEYRCPSCNKKLTVDLIVSYKPVWKADDITLCLNCFNLLIFKQDMQLKVYDKADMKRLHPSLRKIAGQWQATFSLIQKFKKEL